MENEDVTPQEICENVCDSGWCVLQHAYDNDGILVLVLFAIAAVFYKLVWRVWSAAMTAKDNEIDRITAERDYYQSKVFPNLQTSDPSAFQDDGDNS